MGGLTRKRISTIGAVLVVCLLLGSALGYGVAKLLRERHDMEFQKIRSQMGSGQRKEGVPLKVGMQLPDHVFEDLEGHAVSLLEGGSRSNHAEHRSGGVRILS